jgi:4-diphosphocytidyl-2-C-methyl-D-erythritol kinase
MTRRVSVEARAKLNLGLAVGPRRTDGFHELATFFQSVTLADTLIAVPAAHGFTLRVRHEDAAVRRSGPARIGRGAGARIGRFVAAGVPSGPANLVLRAARLVAKHTGLGRGARFTLIKRIPPRSGLGGASSDAAAAIVALDRLFGLGLGSRGRHELAAQLGSDVPFAMRGGTAIGLGRGERLTSIRLARPFRAVIAVPAWRISTPNAFAEIDRKNLGLTDWSAKLRFVQRWAGKDLIAGQASKLGNTFERALGNHHQDFFSLRARLAAAGLRDIALTGSGSAVFGLVKNGEPIARIARRFEGEESLFEVRSARAGLQVVTA